ncbi:MAG: Rrf2 family transcriptional regulator [Xanthomonadales bacterium]|jgi:Rrf2 family protein|nr:Rrf2 family transcriptional regulator [Xanthomonadales bacterium]
MYLSRPAEYSLRAMTYLALQKPCDRVRADDLSKAIDVSGPYLSKIMRRLTVAGLLDAKKGHHGGFKLARQPEEIRFIDILRAVDFEPGLDHCLFGLGNCDAQNPCPLHHEWSVLKNQIEQWAREHTLSEAARDGKLQRQIT